MLKHAEEWHLYESAVVLEVNTESGSVQVRAEYKSPEEARATGQSSNMFKSGTIVGNKLYTCTSTEVLVFDLPAFEISNYISLPCFNDLHHVLPDGEGNLLIASTGLEMVVKTTAEGSVLQQWNVLGEGVWEKFSPEVDYRKVESTKPHRSHPNFVFQLDGQIWVTRFFQRDAICLTSPGKRIEIGIQAPHDGLVRGDKIHFTTVDGHIVTVDKTSLRVAEVVDLKAINGEEALLGWCRGLLPVERDKFWIGFTRVRKTKFRENLLWVRNVFRDGMIEKPSHIALYDTTESKCLREINLESHGLNVVFSIFPALQKAEELEEFASPSAAVRQR